MTWPTLDELLTRGLPKGELYCFMSATPKKLKPDELDEFERRAYALINRRGVRDPNARELWRRNSTVFETDYLMLVNQDLHFVARVCDRVPDSNGIMLFRQAWIKTKATNVVEHRYSIAKIALQHMRDLMVLEDLASL